MAMAMQHCDCVPDRVGACITVRRRSDDFVVICTNRAVLDVGLLSLHDLRADSLIRGQVSNSIVIESLPFFIIIFFLHISFT